MKNIAAAIEFGTSKIICVIGREKSAGRFEVLGSGVAAYEGIKNGRWRNLSNVEEAVSKALYIAERKARKRIKEAYVSIPGIFCNVLCHEGNVYVKGGVVTKKDIESLIDDAEDFYLDPRYMVVTSTPVYFVLDDGNHYIDVIGNQTTQMRGMVSFVLGKKQFIKDVTAIFDSIGIKTKSFIPEMLAESLFLVPTHERDCSAVLINVGYFDTNVTIVYGDAVIYNKTIQAGGRQITNDLSIVMNMDIDTAEQIKKRYSFGLENSGAKLYDYAKSKSGKLVKYKHDIIAQIVDARIEHLCRIIYEHIEQSPLVYTRRARIFLSGGGVAMMKGAKDMLESLLKRQVRILSIEAPQLSTPNYYVALALLDYIFESDYYGEGYGGESILKRLSDKMND